MQVFQDLEISGEPPVISRWVEEVSKSVQNGWQRDRTREAELGLHDAEYLCFARKASGDAPSANLYLHTEPAGLRLANIIPFERELDVAQYNAILKEFHDVYAKPAADRVGARIALSKETVALSEVLAPDAEEKLRRFSALANRFTGASHPEDHRRWLDFVVSAHRSGSDLSEGLLQRLLEEELGWSSATAAELAGQFQAAIEVLRFYDRTDQAA